MSQASLLEAQFANFVTRSDYGSAREGVLLFDMDAGEPTTPENVGLAANLDTINDFAAFHGADPEHLKYTTIGLFGPDSSYATIPGTTIERNGFVGDGLHVTGDVGLRFPLIALRHDSSKPNVRRLNSSLRHEVDHLLRANRTAPYNSEPLIARLKITSAIGSLVTPLAAAMWDQSVAAEALRAGVSVNEYTSALLSSSIGSLAALTATYGLVAKPQQVMRKFSLSEYRADHFSRKNRHFQPFSQA